MKINILNLLHEKLKPAMGCTEPIAIALAGAIAMNNASEIDVDKIEIEDTNIRVRKNRMILG